MVDEMIAIALAGELRRPITSNDCVLKAMFGHLCASDGSAEALPIQHDAMPQAAGDDSKLGLAIAPLGKKKQNLRLHFFHLVTRLSYAQRRAYSESLEGPRLDQL